MARDFEDIRDLDDLNDDEMRQLVRERIAEHTGLDPDDITVRVEAGQVVLEGRVGTDGERRIAEHVVTDVVGIVDVRDIAALHLDAMVATGAGGHRFLASAGTLSLIELARALRQRFPSRAVSIPRFVVPDWIVRLYALLDRDLRDNLGALGASHPLDASRAEALLGRPFIAPADAAVATAQSLIDMRLV